METRKRSILSILAMIIVLAVSAGCLFGCGSGYEKVVEKYFEAIKKGDAKKYISLYPEEVVDAWIEYECDGDKEELTDYIKDLLDELDNGDIDISKLKYKIIDAEELDKDELEELTDDLDEFDIDVKEAINLEIEITVPVDGEKEELTFEMLLGKIDGSWYVLYDLDDMPDEMINKFNKL